MKRELRQLPNLLKPAQPPWQLRPFTDFRDTHAAGRHSAHRNVSGRSLCRHPKLEEPVNTVWFLEAIRRRVDSRRGLSRLVRFRGAGSLCGHFSDRMLKSLGF